VPLNCSRSPLTVKLFFIAYSKTLTTPALTTLDNSYFFLTCHQWLLAKVPNHPDFEEWLEKGTLPAKAIKELCAPFREQEPFVNQPGRFYTSAIALVHYMFKSWLKVQKKLRQRIEGKQRWLAMLKSNQELEAESGKSISEIRLLALKILQQIDQQLDNQKINPKKKQKKRKTTKSQKKSSTIFNSLFERSDEATDSATKCAIVYLLKNGCQIDEENEDDEDLEEYILRRRKKEIEIENLQKQLRSRLPSGRDLQCQLWHQTLEAIEHNYVPENNTEARLLQDHLSRKSAAVPYPVAYESNTDLTWLEDEQGNLFVKFNGLGDHKFEIRCDTRQLDWFRRFLEDQKLKEKSKKDKKEGHRENELSSALFGLRSGRILWREGEQQPDRCKKTITRAFLLLFLNQEYKLALILLQSYRQLKKRLRQEQPWNYHRFYLQCSIDTRLWTKESTALVAQEKTAKSKDAIAQCLGKAEIAQTEEKGKLDLEQQKHIKRKQTQLANLQNLPERPHKDLYMGNTSIILGISLGLKKPITVAVVDVVSGRVLTYRSAKQLLGKNYKLLNRQRQEKLRLSIKRHKAQKRNAPNNFGELNLGKQVDRLFANAVIELARSFRASSIVLPEVSQIREITQSEVQAKAEKKILGYKEGQKKYAQQYRVNIHNWSYGRLTDFISQKANIEGIPIEKARQPLGGSNQEQAKQIAIAAYNSRLEKAV
ncbi:MAG: type V CRISPR-associated protein Cas12k, partial [Xenococcaceae cyanobacterium MO_167.B52]|nr:type V CRISPR-associated protein Cas12k [Xenococcaceae cyanobacterium MO_167.B52]